MGSRGWGRGGGGEGIGARRWGRGDGGESLNEHATAPTGDTEDFDID